MIGLGAGVGSIFRAGGGDPYADMVISSVAMESPLLATAVVDTKGKAWTRTGAFVINDAPGYAAGYFDGGWLETPSHGDWDFSSLDFTIEGFVRPSIINGVHVLAGRLTGGTSGDSWRALINSGGQLQVLVRGVSQTVKFGQSDAGAFATGVESHWAMQREGDYLVGYVNRVPVVSVPLEGGFTVYNNNAPVQIGINREGLIWPLRGHMRRFRATRGVARGPAHFLPPPPLTWLNRIWQWIFPANCCESAALSHWVLA